MNKKEKNNVLHNIITLCPDFNEEVKFYNNKPEKIIIKKFLTFFF